MPCFLHSNRDISRALLFIDKFCYGNEKINANTVWKTSITTADCTNAKGIVK
jgi:hypothetical protein